MQAPCGGAANLSYEANPLRGDPMQGPLLGCQQGLWMQPVAEEGADLFSSLSGAVSGIMFALCIGFCELHQLIIAPRNGASSALLGLGPSL